MAVWGAEGKLAPPKIEDYTYVCQKCGKTTHYRKSTEPRTTVETLSAEILNSAEIEGERLNRDDVRSSVAKRMDIVLSGAKSATSREAEARQITEHDSLAPAESNTRHKA